MLSSAVVTHPARVRYYCPASATPPRDCNGRAGVFEPPTKAPRTVVTHRYQIVHFNSKSSSFWRFWRNIWHLVHFQFRKNTQKRVFRNSGNSRQIEVVFVLFSLWLFRFDEFFWRTNILVKMDSFVLCGRILASFRSIFDKKEFGMVGRKREIKNDGRWWIVAKL